MSFNKCPGCDATVEASKAYCLECGAPMDEERKNSDSSEFDSLMQTQNINRTNQFRLIEQFNLSSIFSAPKNVNESNAVENETKPVSANPQRETQNNQRKTESIALKPQIEDSAASKKTEAAFNSNKRLYVALGVGLFFLVSVLTAAIVFGFLFWNYSR